MSETPTTPHEDEKPTGFSISAAEWVPLYPGVDVRLMVTRRYDAATAKFHTTFEPFIEGKDGE